MYYHSHVARVWAEMVRPGVAHSDSDGPWAGHSVETLLVAGLARAIQTKLYLHSCTPKYCLKNRTKCRFFFPWPRQATQQYDANTERVALKRADPEDDQWVVPHSLSIAMFSPSTVNLLPFDPDHGTDTARQYVCKYASKPEKYFYIDSCDSSWTSVKYYLKARVVSLAMAINRLLENRCVRSTKAVVFTPAQFVRTAANGGTLRDERHRGPSLSLLCQLHYLFTLGSAKIDRGAAKDTLPKYTVLCWGWQLQGNVVGAALRSKDAQLTFIL